MATINSKRLISLAPRSWVQWVTGDPTAEPLLAFFAAFVMPVHEVTSKMRWDMAVLRATPWYDEIVNECVEECFEKGMQLDLQRDQLERLWRVQDRRVDVSLQDLMLCLRCSSGF